MLNVGGIQFPDSARMTYEVMASQVGNDPQAVILVDIGENQIECSNCGGLGIVVLKFLDKPSRTPHITTKVSTPHRGRWYITKTHSFQCPVCGG